MVTRKKEVAEKQDNLPMAGVDFESDAGGGMEGADKDSFAIPFLAVAQKMSPHVDEAEAKYIEGLKPGFLFNTVTTEFFDGKDGVTFIPCAFQRRFIRWAPRGDGGFKGELMPEEVAKLRDRGDVIPDGGRLYYPDENGEINEKKCDYLADVRNHFGLLVVDGVPHQVLLSLGSTQIKKSKQLMSMMSNAKVQGKNGKVTPPTWMNQFTVTTVLESNDEGSWYGVKFTPDGFIDDPDLYAAGKQFYEAIAAGEAKVNYAEGEDKESDEKF